MTELDPLPVVWNGHSPYDSTLDKCRTSVRLDLHSVFDYRFDPRPQYEQDESKYLKRIAFLNNRKFRPRKESRNLRWASTI